MLRYSRDFFDDTVAEQTARLPITGRALGLKYALIFRTLDA